MNKFVLMVAAALVMSTNVYAGENAIVDTLDGINTKLTDTQAKIEAQKANVAAKKADLKAQKEAKKKEQAERKAAVKAKTDAVKSNMKDLKKSFSVK